MAAGEKSQFDVLDRRRARVLQAAARSFPGAGRRARRSSPNARSTSSPLPSSPMRRLLILVLVPLSVAACGGARSAPTTTTATTTARVAAGLCHGRQPGLHRVRQADLQDRPPLARPEGLGQDRRLRRTGDGRDEARCGRPPARAAAFKQMLRYGNALALSIQEVHDALVKKDYDTAVGRAVRRRRRFRTACTRPRRPPA